MRTVSRGGSTFSVFEAPDRHAWDFWGLWESGGWEPDTFDVIDRFVTAGSAYVDVGAWIGPTVLYAARRCARVVAVEPDPEALEALNANLTVNGIGNVEVVAAAVTRVGGRVALHARDGWGSSMSTVIPAGETVMFVDAVTFADVFRRAGDSVALVKIDVEGAEADWLGDAVDIAAGVPCWISLHEPMYGPDRAVAVRAALGRFRRLTLDGRPVSPADVPVGYCTVLGEW